jgi:amino acid transporter
MQWLVVLPLEIVAASVTINFWDPETNIDRAIFVTIFSVVKVAAVVGYM